MSALTEAADAEVEAAMNETPDEEEAVEEEETAVEPEPEPEPAPVGLSEKEAERLSKDLDRTAQRYIEKAFAIVKQLGLPVEACPLCLYPGVTMQRHESEVTSDVVSNVLRLIGREDPPDYPDYDGFQRCPTCDGWGEVATKSRKDIASHTVCPNGLCGGKGYVTVSIDPVPATNVAQFPGAHVPYTPLPAGLPDQWGRPAGHPHWGLEPSSVGA